MGPNLFWKSKILKKVFLRPAGPGIRNSPGPEKRWTTRGLKCSGQQLNFDFFDLGMPGNPDPKKSGKRVKFQISPEKFENGLSTSKSSPGSILILLQYKIKKKQPLFRFFFSNFPLCWGMGSLAKWHWTNKINKNGKKMCCPFLGDHKKAKNNVLNNQLYKNTPSYSLAPVGWTNMK